MSDWRKKPRTGKQEFLKFLDEIKLRVINGESQIEIHESLSLKGLTISYQQFNRYVGKFVYDKVVKVNQPKSISDKEDTTEEQPSPLVIADTDSWDMIGITSARLIEDLKEAGFTASDVKNWNCANDRAVRLKFTEIQSQRSRGR